MFNVLSFDPERIQVSVAPDGRAIVTKTTRESEYVNILSARKHLFKHQPIIASTHYGETRVCVAEVYEWDQSSNSLSTFFCEGENLEENLKATIGSNRTALLGLIKEVFRAFSLCGFLWGDFAPRNMLWNKRDNIIWLVDFERALRLKDCPIKDSLFTRYVREYSREEFSCFLTQHESATLFTEFTREDTHGFIPANLIASRRKATLLKTLHGQKEYYSMNEVREAEDLMVYAATPFLIHGTFFFPMEIIDFISEKRGPHEYASLVTKIKELDTRDRFAELKRQVQSV